MEKLAKMAAVAILAASLLPSEHHFSALRLAVSEFTREDFPADFVFGAGTSAFQYEGAAAEDGRTPSVLDPADKSADVASNGYHKYKEDADLMSNLGLEAYRFSISWSRLIPSWQSRGPNEISFNILKLRSSSTLIFDVIFCFADGRGKVNLKGVDYYNSVLKELIKRGIEPHVTLNHLDYPRVLNDTYGGWFSPQIVDDFKVFADVCFKEFGDKVSHWTTMDEPNLYGMIDAPVARCSLPLVNSNCTADNSSNKQYNMVHNMLLAHSEVVKLYRMKYQEYQKGSIGLNVYTFWCEPLSNSSADIEATERAKNFMFGWLLNPIVFGDYPEIMKKISSPRLPRFTKSQSEVLKGSFDFIGLNYYVAAYISDNTDSPKRVQDFKADLAVNMRVHKNDPPTSAPFLANTVPDDFSGLQKMMEYIKENYLNPPIYLQENGFATSNGVDSLLNDTVRIEYLKGYIGRTLEAIRSGIEVKGYFAWSLVDVYEFFGGYNTSFGLYHVDFNDDDRPRTPKLSAHWFSSFLNNNLRADLKDLHYASK